MTHRGQPSERVGALQSGWSASTAPTAGAAHRERDAYGTAPLALSTGPRRPPRRALIKAALRAASIAVPLR